MTEGFRSVPNDLKGGLAQVGSNIWTIEGRGFTYYRPPIQPVYPYPHRAVVIRLYDRSLLVISPTKLDSDVRDQVDALGPVGHIVSPNAIHHLHMGEWHREYPDAQLYASPRLVRKRRDLTFANTISTDDPEPVWDGQLEQRVFGPKGSLPELVFFHRESRSLVLTDLVMDFDPSIFSAVARVTSRLNQMYRHTPRGMQLANIHDRPYLRRTLADIKVWQAEHAIVAHSPWLCVDGRTAVSDFLDAAFGWLVPWPGVLESVMATARLLALRVVGRLHPIVERLDASSSRKIGPHR